MTVRELIKKLSKLSKAGHGDRPVEVPVMGGLRGGGVGVTGASSGFDWHMGRVLIQTATPLEPYMSRSERRAQIARYDSEMKKMLEEDKCEH